MDQLEEDLPYCKSEIVKARGELRKAGWLEVVKASYQNERGCWTVPTYKPAIPEQITIFPKTPRRTPKPGKPLAENPARVPLPENPLPDHSGNTASGKPATTVDTGIPIDTAGSDASRLPVNTSTPSLYSPLAYNETSEEICEILGIMRNENVRITDPDRAKEFAQFMIERFPLKKDGTPRIVSLKDFLHHWNNESGSDTGFRLQWETLRFIQEKTDAPKEVPSSDWDWICRAPACNKPWTDEIDGIKLCARCFAAFPDHPAEKEVKWVHPCECSYEGEVTGVRRCCQPTTEQVGDYWICSAHVDAVSEQLNPADI